MITFASVCTGIGAPEVAWAPLGWRPVWFAEIEPFPSAVLAHHYPQTPNLGDMTKIAALVRHGLVDAPDVLVGGTPCQAFSVAGVRGGLADPRGQLTLAYADLANAIDEKRPGDECVIYWENVPGVLSSKDNAFGCFLGLLAGEDSELTPEPKPAPGKNSKYWKWSKSANEHTCSWPDAGVVYGPQRAIAWRVLDAKYFGVPQQRKRVFVVASARGGFDSAAVLFEPDGDRRNKQEGSEGAAYPCLQTTCNDYSRADGFVCIQHGDRWRRLLPSEASRLQGFPAGYLENVSYRGKPAADGPIYKAFGNSMAVPCMYWLGVRLMLAHPEFFMMRLAA